jgi:hypothetical protein
MASLVQTKAGSTALNRSGIARSPLRIYNRRTYVGSDGTALNALSKFYGPDRDKVFGPFSDNIIPSHLKGEYPGDYGWDWVGLCADPERFEFLRQAEVINGRWALFGVLGCLVPEFLVRNNGASIFGDGVWFKTNAAALTPEGANILGLGFGFGNNLPFLFVSTILVLGFTEVWRYNRSGGGFEGPYDPLYPGWDPLGVMNDPDTAAELKVKELKNARLAMVSFLGFLVQGLVTGKGPLENLADHLADPIHNNAITNIAGVNAAKILG